MINVSIVAFQSAPTPPSEKGWVTLGTLKVCISYQGLEILIDGIKPREKEGKHFYGMPSRKGDDGLWKETVSFPKETLYQITNAIDAAFKQFLASSPESTWAPAAATIPMPPSYPDGHTSLFRSAPGQLPPMPSPHPAQQECPF